MNRLIELSKRQELASFAISIYRDDLAYCGYGVHCFRQPFASLPTQVHTARLRQFAEDLFLSEVSILKLNG